MSTATMSTATLEQLASEFPKLDPDVVADVLGSSLGNIDCVRGQLKGMMVPICFGIDMIQLLLIELP